MKKRHIKNHHIVKAVNKLENKILCVPVHCCFVHVESIFRFFCVVLKLVQTPGNLFKKLEFKETWYKESPYSKRRVQTESVHIHCTRTCMSMYKEMLYRPKETNFEKVD